MIPALSDTGHDQPISAQGVSEYLCLDELIAAHVEGRKLSFVIPTVEHGGNDARD